MIPTGTLDDDGRTLVLTRRFAARAEDVWAAVTESDRLAHWFGTWTGDPAHGSVMVTMTAEAEPVPPVRYDIVACEPPRRLAVDAVDDFGTWHLRLELTAYDGGTLLTFRQEDVDPTSVGDTGPGWEWYLDRLGATLGGAAPPSLADFDADYMPMKSAYATMRP